MADTAAGIMDRLRAETAELHRFAETRELQKRLAKGELPPAAFAQYLGQLLYVHRTLEAALRLAPANSPLAVVFQTYQQREADIVRDLEHYGLDPDSIPIHPATKTVIQQIVEARDEHPTALLGHLYVLEGSMNGNRFISMVVRRKYGLDSDAGVAYLDPYGEAQKQRWQQFKDDMSAVQLTAADQQAILQAAGAMFNGIAAISDSVFEAEVTGAVHPRLRCAAPRLD